MSRRIVQIEAVPGDALDRVYLFALDNNGVPWIFANPHVANERSTGWRRLPALPSLENLPTAGAASPVGEVAP